MTKTQDDSQLFANDPYIYGYYSLSYIQDIIDPDENEQVLVFPKMQEISDYQKIFSIWELFCNLVVEYKSALPQTTSAKEILM